jgi:hypothetical protein
MGTIRFTYACQAIRLRAEMPAFLASRTARGRSLGPIETQTPSRLTSLLVGDTVTRRSTKRC